MNNFGVRCFAMGIVAVMLLLQGAALDATETLRQEFPSVRDPTYPTRGGTSVPTDGVLLFAKPGEKVPVLLDAPAGMETEGAWPVTFGMPFPTGALWKTAAGTLPIRFVDRDGGELPFQADVTARWAPDGSVKWLRVDALVTPKQGCFMEAAAPAEKPRTALQLVEEPDGVRIDTGAAVFRLGKGPSPIREIRHKDRCVAKSEETRGLYLVDQKGRLASAAAEGERMEVEARGPVTACVRFEGWYQTAEGQRLARHITRVEAFAGHAFLRVTHTLVLTEDTNRVWFKDLGWELAVEPGASPEAIFGLAPPARDFSKTAAVPLQGPTRSAYMLQDAHYRFAHGTNHFAVVRVGADGREIKQVEGDECGDWGALRGQAGGLLVDCRDAARQHPKEFEIFGDRLTLRLFSNRAGEELDYRTKTLMKRWHLPEWIKLHNELGRVHGALDEQDFLRQVEALANNAAGGARTHDLLFAAVAPDAKAEVLARLGGLHGQPVYAAADPQWIYQTRVMGPNHPRDMKRFPDAEKGVDAAFQYYLDADAAWGEHGFVDYFGGPHASSYLDDRVPALFRYIETSYYFNAQIWLLYARSGQRKIRQYAEGSNRAHLDNRFAHWGEKTGWWRCANESVAARVPLYWHPEYRLADFGSHLNNFIWHYYLTGDRRMKDGILEFAGAFKEGWSEAWVRGHFWVHDVVQHCAQMYAFTGDKTYAEMGQRTLDLMTDPQSGILLTKRAYKSSTYKAYQVIRSLIEAYWLQPTPQLRETCLRICQYLEEYPYAPYGYTPAGSVVGPFLYDQTADPAQVQSLAIAVRNIGGLADPQTGRLAPAMRSKVRILPYTSFLFDIGYVRDVLVRGGAERMSNVASWACYTDELGRARVVFRKTENEAAGLRFQSDGAPRITALENAINQVNAQDASLIAIHQNRLNLETGGACGRIVIPKDVPAGDYAIQFDSRGTTDLFASGRHQLVLYAPDYWLPMQAPGLEEADEQRPPLRFYFNVPKNSVEGRIFFAGQAQLFDPAGQPWPAKGPVRGWVDLPADQPGLWSFDSLRQGMVRMRNLPPFFAFNDADAYFEPALDWKSDTPVDEIPLRKDALYVTGASHEEKDRALHLSGGRSFQITHPPSGGSGFFPNSEGSLEFFIRPNWSSFDLQEGEIRSLVCGLPGLFVEHRCGRLSFTWPTEGKLGAAPFGGNRTGSCLLIKDRWVHLAMVWGPSLKPEPIWGNYGSKSITDQARQRKLDFTIYLAGQKAPQGYINHPIPADGQTCAPITSLTIGGLGEQNRLEAAIDSLRLSDFQRYRGNFTPPSPESPMAVDAHTKALFFFDGNLEGRSHGLKEPFAGKLNDPAQ